MRTSKITKLKVFVFILINLNSIFKKKEFLRIDYSQKGSSIRLIKRQTARNTVAVSKVLRTKPKRNAHLVFCKLQQLLMQAGEEEMLANRLSIWTS